MSIHYMANEVQRSNQRRVQKIRKNAGAIQGKIMTVVNQTMMSLQKVKL